MRHYSRTEMAQVFDHILGERMPGAGAQGINVLSTTQNYKIGARMQISNRVYHYGQSGGICLDNQLSFMMNGQDSGMTAIGVGGVAPAGATRITIMLANGGGPAQNGAYPANYLAGGSIIFMTAGGIYTRGILSNTAVAAGGGASTITIDAPIINPLIAADSTEVTASRYVRVVPNGDVTDGSQFASAVGLATLPCVAEDYLWFQTWGPVWFGMNLTIGVAGNNRVGYVAADGSAHPLATGGAEWQKAGTLINNAIGGGQGAPFLNLELDP